MSLGAVASIAGGALGFMGSQSSNDAQLEAAEAARDLPEWLKPYYIGDAGEPPSPVPINYNWLDSLAQVAQTGEGGVIPPMHMNNPMMTFENVHTPMEGGPWGYGLGPGQLTADVGIPGSPGPQFLPQPDGFQPGVTGPPGAVDAGGGGLGLDQAMLDQARRYVDVGNMFSSFEDEFQPTSTLDALEWAMQNQDVEPGRLDYDMVRAIRG